MIPVDRATNDPFYRYQMPALQIAHESNRTVLVNLEQVARALYRDPAHILKYTGMTLGCTQVRDGARYFLNGNFDGKRLQSIVYDFIDFFVLCRACGNPETRFVESGGLRRSCSSCGAVVAQDPHKLNSVIAKDVEKCVNQDTRYDASNGHSIASLLRDEEDASDRVYSLFEQENLRLSDLFTEYFKPSGLKQLSKVLARFKTEEVLENVETMLENSRREDKISSFLKALCRMGYTIGGIERYFAAARKGKKRSPLIRKNAEYFIASYDD